MVDYSMYNKDLYNTQYHTEDLSKSNFLITGGAGFIGSNIVEYLLKYGAKKVRVLDNLSTGSYDNISTFENLPSFEFIEGDIRNIDTCRKATAGMDYVLHHAALGSVPRSINDPLTSNEVNVSGFLNMLVAIKESTSVKRTIYAASSSTYGDHPALPKVEDVIGKPLSPYAITKYVNELYADVFAKTYGIDLVGLRYFNVFGPKQNPNGAYAAVIPKFILALMDKQSPVINGDGSYSRDFTFIENVIQMNMLALFTHNTEALNTVYNTAYGERTTLVQLFDLIKMNLRENDELIEEVIITNGPNRVGDIPHSLASIDKARELLKYNPLYSIKDGIRETCNWYWKTFKNK
jgi:UDP-N-acetylglucosamine 4-epimerase